MPNRSTFFHHLHPPTIPSREARFRYTFGLGGISVFLFAWLVVTGLLELFYYVPSLEEANRSVQAITFLVPYGWLVRGVHYWAAQALVVTASLHLLRVVLTGAYKRPRRFNWLLGLGLLVGVLLLDFTGYALRWDEDIAWALIVGTNLLKSIPLVGPALYGLIVGGGEIGSATAVRFYGWHIFGLALPAGAIVAWHIFRVRRDGGISQALPDDGDALAPKPDRISRNELVRREAPAMLVVTAILLLLALLFPPALGAAGDFSHLPAEAEAPWFFAWVQELLRLGDPFIMGVLIPLGLLALLALLPYVIDRTERGVGRWFNREGRRAQWLVLSLAALIVGLMLKGALG
jgi:quinol-cytochrome oxidoreductase complex cytochrome b subunit